MFRQASKRPLKFAGSWYESDPKRLASQLDGYQAAGRAKTDPIAEDLVGRNVLAVVAPHAGYTFSGQTAAISYLVPNAASVKRVFLLGPSHYRAFRGAAVSADKSFATVFGDLPVDTAAISRLRGGSGFHELSDVHREEHSLEMQLAFIKRDYGNVKIVPILIGKLDTPADALAIGAQIKSLLRPGDLLAVSSDFTHYGPRYGYTPFSGAGKNSSDTISADIKALDMEAFSYLQLNDLDGFFSFYKRTEDTICGVYALAVLLAILPEDARAHLVDYRTSRDSIVEDDQNSVSYLSIAFVSGGNWADAAAEPETLNDTLTDGEKAALMRLARATLESFVRDGAAPDVTKAPFDRLLDRRLKQKQGAFVTLFRHLPPGESHPGVGTVSGARDGKELRGCIGYILPVKPLYQTVIDNCIAACSRDGRFDPVGPGELADIEIDISVLTAPKSVASYKEIRVGVDGILLYCGGKQSVFLPHVATEFGWDLDETLNQLAHKAGLPRNAWKNASARFETFQAISIEEGRPGQRD